MLKQEYKVDEMDVEACLQLAIKVLSKTLDTNKITAEKVEIATLTRENGVTRIKVLPEEKLNQVIKKHEEAEAASEAEKKKETKA